jgi:hypothetical protein
MLSTPGETAQAQVDTQEHPTMCRTLQETTLQRRIDYSRTPKSAERPRRDYSALGLTSGAILMQNTTGETTQVQGTTSGTPNSCMGAPFWEAATGEH